MSLPAAFAGHQATAMLAISPLDGFLQIFNNNPYFIGLMMLILNLGGRFISLEVTKKQEQFLQHPWVRRVLIFTVLFVATRNIWVAFWATLTFVLFLGYLFNENSALCLFGTEGRAGSTCSEGGPAPGEEMTPEEKEILQRLSAKAQRYQTADEQGKKKSAKRPEQENLERSLRGMDDDSTEEEDTPHTDIYAANLTLLK